MIRRVVVSSTAPISGEVSVLYYVRGARVISCNYVIKGDYATGVTDTAARTPVVFDNAIRFFIYVNVSGGRKCEYILDVDENQPDLERVKEVTSVGVNVTVYNADGVIVCDNGIQSSGTQSTPVITDGPGEMTTEPIDGPGEMTSAPGEEPGEMI